MASTAYSIFQYKSMVFINFKCFISSLRTKTFEGLLFPLDVGIDNPRSLDVLSSIDRPFWLGSDPFTDASIDSVRVVNPDFEPIFLRNWPAVTMPSPAPSAAALAGKRNRLGGAHRIHHLFVLEGGREE